MKKLINILPTLLLVIFYITECPSQIAGVSAQKLTLQSASVLPPGTFEFEPAFSVLNAKKVFNESWESVRQPGQNTSSSLDFRMTVGLTEQFEMGASISSSVEEILLGTKYILLSNEDFGFALSGGTSLPAGNRFVADSSISDEFIYKASFGPVISYNLSETNSIDIAVLYTTKLGSSNFSDQVYAGFGWGYLLRDDLQLIVEVAGFTCLNKENCSSKLSLFPGLTYDVSANFSFALGFQHDLIGKNEDNAFGYFGAFTISFN